MLFLKLYLNDRTTDRVMSKYRKGSGFLDTDRQVATVATETTQLVLSQFKNFLPS